MSLESILEHIQQAATLEREEIIRQAKKEKDAIIRQAQKEADKLYQETLEKEKLLSVKERQKAIVQARLEARQNLLKAKQELIDGVFKEIKSELGKAGLKKRQIAHDRTHEVSEDIDFYLGKLRQDYEAEIAKILF